MNILYAKRFSKDIDAIRHETKIKKRLLDLIGQIKKAEAGGTFINEQEYEQLETLSLVSRSLYPNRQDSS